MPGEFGKTNLSQGQGNISARLGVGIGHFSCWWASGFLTPSEPNQRLIVTLATMHSSQLRWSRQRVLVRGDRVVRVVCAPDQSAAMIDLESVENRDLPPIASFADWCPDLQTI